MPAIPWAEEAEPVCGDVYVDDDPSKPLIYPSDLVPFKPRADVLLNGTAYAPGGRAAPFFPVGFRVGDLTKSLHVFGARAWPSPITSQPSASAPLPIACLPLGYQYAFGGPSYDRNPTGIGHLSTAAPQLEDVRRPATGPNDTTVEPAGFGPLPANWRQRSSLVGTYGAEWREQRWPWLPSDFDWGHFNAAPRDQQVEGYLVGDELLELQNLHPEIPVYRAQLPGVRARCFTVQHDLAGQRTFREVPLVLDTLWIDAGREKIVLIWRGMTPVRSIKLRDVEAFFVFQESLADAPRSLADSYTLFTARLADAEAAETAGAAADTGIDEIRRESAAHFQAVESQAAAFEKRLARAETEAAQGLDEQLRSLSSGRPTSPAGPNDVPTSPSALQAVFTAALADARAADPESVSAADHVDMSEFVDMESEAREDEAAAAAATPARLSVADVAARRSNGHSLAGFDLSELDLSGLDFAGSDLQGASLRGATLRGAKMSRANLSKADLSKADLSEADLTGAVLDGADLAGAVLTGARLRDLSVSYAVFSKLSLAGADFSGCSGEWCEFIRADLTGATFTGANLRLPDFSGAALRQADFRTARLFGADFEGAQAQGIDMSGADLTRMNGGDHADFSDANLSGAAAEGSVWGESLLNRVNFSRARLAGALFPDTSLQQANFDRADVTGGVFDDADLEGAIMTNANFLRCSFDRANLTGVPFYGANLYGAGFAETILTRTDFRGANIKGTALV